MIGTCPKCGDAVVEGESKYFCRSNDCDFQFGKKILEQPINQVQAAKLLSHRRTDVLDGFISKSGKPFPAYLVMDHAGKITFEFPSRESDSDSDNETGHSGEMVDCKALLNAATKNIFRANAFRITGLPVDATGREMAKHVDKLKIMAELGQAHPSNHSALALKPSPTLDHIREAIQKLKEPELRIIDELFWLWPEDFGDSQNDPALQAINQDCLKRALEIWEEKEAVPTNGFVARHNLWIYAVMVAIERELDLLQKDDEKLRGEANSYWQLAGRYFHALANDPMLVARLAHRIRVLDDARLPETFALQIQASLPKALASISAELAMMHAQKGNQSRASILVRLARETIGRAQVDEMFQVLLVSHKSRVQEMARLAKEKSEGDPDNGGKIIFSLIETAKPMLAIFDLFLGNDNYARNDLFDDVANACTNCAVDYQKKTGDDQMFLSLLEHALPYAASSETRQRVNKNIAIAKSNLAGKKLQPVFDKLSRITKDDSSPRTKMARINDEVVSDLSYYSSVAQLPTDAIDELSDRIAAALRSISIDLFNQHNDTDNALVAIDQAIRLAKDPELIKRVNDDRTQLRKLKSEQESHDLGISIRDDQIEVTAKAFRYNGTKLPVEKINGIKFGIFTHYTNGAKTSVSYTIGLSGIGCADINIECKRFFRNEDQAKLDFEAILDSCFYHIVPTLVTRLADQIASGQELQLGDLWLSHKGIRTTVGILMWKEELFVPWSDVRFGVHQGRLNLGSPQHKKFTKSYSLRDTWNAVIFEQITKALSKKRT